jgi:hypothetical protein
MAPPRKIKPMPNGQVTCNLGPQANKLGFCNCYCDGCHPENPLSAHCRNHYYYCHRMCGDAARKRR